MMFIGDSREPWDEEKSNNTTLFQFKMLVDSQVNAGLERRRGRASSDDVTHGPDD